MTSAPRPMSSRERFLAAARGEAVDRPPVWLMRQAGRYLPEYRRVRAGIPFMELCRDVERAVEVSLQPWERFGVDAVIMFSDILVPLQAMGIPVEIGEGGPRILAPLRDASDVARLRGFDPEEETGFVMQILRTLVRRIEGKAALLGFAGAPFTTACYAIEGASSKGFPRTRALLRENPRLLHAILEKLADATVGYLKAQIAAGADAVQLFDTWGGDLPDDEYRTFAAPYQARVLSRIGDGVPRILYVNGAAAHVEAMADTGATVLSVDSGLPLAEARRRAPALALQGNVEPTLLLGDEAPVRAAVRGCLDALGGRGHILNLGHGVLKETAPEMVAALVDEARAWRAP